MEREKGLNVEEWFLKISRPLEFVSKNNFANLSKTKGLEKTLNFLISNAPEELKEIKKELLELCTDLEKSSLEEKKEKIIKMIDLLRSLRSFTSERENSFGLEENNKNFVKYQEILENKIS